jgi:hypothetical protein
MSRRERLALSDIIALGCRIMDEAAPTTIATGTEPLPGRSDHAGFGDLVHSVFQRLHEPAPDQALRRYWNEVEKGRSRSAA